MPKWNISNRAGEEMKKGARKNDYKLGQIHGKLNPDKSDSEARLQRTVFLSQKILIKRSNHEPESEIRLFGYEVPLTSGRHRGECVDLLGYDCNRDLYVIELKRGGSKEKIVEIQKQIEDYARAIEGMKSCLEEAFQETYLLPVVFKEVKKILLAPKEFYDNKDWAPCLEKGIECVYYRDRDIQDRDPGEIYMTRVHLKK